VSTEWVNANTIFCFGGSFNSSALLDVNNKPETLLPPNRMATLTTPDIFEISLLLNVAGIRSLDEPSLAEPGKTLRESGLVLLVSISYDNTWTFDLNKIRYQIRVSELKDTPFRAIQPIYTNNITTRAVLIRYGIRIIVLQGGTIGTFDFPTLLLSFITGMGLSNFAVFVVDTLATRILPKKQEYAAYKFEVSKEFNSKRSQFDLTKQEPLLSGQTNIMLDSHPFLNSSE
jgi:hypothetical protein